MCVSHTRARTRYWYPDLAARLGIPSFREHQQLAIDAAADGRDILNIAPTGSGKTEGFLGAGLARGGMTVIASPLRALGADQYRRLTERGLPVRLWNSDVDDGDKDESLRLIREGWTGFIITTPESLQGRMLSDALQNRVTTAVVDEAHCCLRERGFRFAYAVLGATLDRLNPGLRFACTATLPRDDRDHLVRDLRLRNPVIIQSPVARSNLQIRIVDRSMPALHAILRKHNGEAGIVFCATVCAAESIYARLLTQGWRVCLYHGRLNRKDKKVAQSAFMSGDKPVAIVTDAFLLGIDKADLRFVVHMDYPKSTEDWVQGFGRAGRDGLPADVYGAFLGSDEGRTTRLFLINSTYPPVDHIRAVWDYLVRSVYRDQSQSQLAETVLGKVGRYSGPSILTTLQRFHLATAEPQPDDGRRKRYRSAGSFDEVDWSKYEREADRVRDRFDQLCTMVRQPEDLIPDSIDAYFEQSDDDAIGWTPAAVESAVSGARGELSE